MQAYQFDQVIRDYRRLRTLVPLGTLRTKKDYTRAVERCSLNIEPERYYLDPRTHPPAGNDRGLCGRGSSCTLTETDIRQICLCR